MQSGVWLPARQTTALWSIHYLRALAALGVVLFHSLDDTGWQFNIGAAGIHLFFTISGFVIWQSTASRPVSFRPFIIARLLRIVPLYWLATFVSVLSIFVMPGYFWQATTRPVNLVTSLLFIPHEGVSGGVFPVLYQGWTLQYEMYFYAVFAICLLAARPRRMIALAAWLALTVAAGLAFTPRGPLLETYTNPICLEFLAGALVAQALPAVSRWLRPGTAALLTAGGAAGFVLADTFESRLGWLSMLALPLGTGSTVMGLVWLEQAGKMIRSPWLRFAGEASYSTYLFQTVGFALVSALLPHIPAPVRVVLFVTAAQACGCVVFRFIERPIIGYSKALVTRRSRQAPGTEPQAA